MTVTRKLTILLAAATLVLTAAAAFGGVYRWVDAKGVVHYSDTPPPTGAEQLDIDTAPTDTSVVAARQKRTQAKLKKFDQQRKAKTEATAKAAKQQKAAQAACAKAKKRVASLAGARRVRSTGKGGKVTWLSGKDLVDYRRAAKERAAKLCSGA